MRRVWNVNDFSKQLNEIFGHSDKFQVPNLQKDLSEGTIEHHLWLKKEELLEHHEREFVIDHMLQALNWSLSPKGSADDYINMAGEVGVDEKDEKRKYLDYLGFEKNIETVFPLLLVEAKRSSYKLPEGNISSIFSKYLFRIEDLETKALVGYWRDFLDTLKKYIKRIHQQSGKYPVRYLITNSEWVVIIENPNYIFETDDYQILEESIHVFKSRLEILATDGSQKIFNLLNYFSISKTKQPLKSSELAFQIVDEDFIYFAHGLHIDYATVPTNRYSKAPYWSISPIILLLSKSGSIATVCENDSCGSIDVTKHSDLGNNIKELAVRGENFKTQVLSIIGEDTPVISAYNYSKESACLAEFLLFNYLEQSDNKNSFTILTGEHCHFLVDNNIMCKSNCITKSSSPVKSIINAASVDPKSMSINGEPWHCVHENIDIIKKHPLKTEDGKNGFAFCMIYDIDQRICCKRCVFYQICVSDTFFSNPPCDSEIVDAH